MIPFLKKIFSTKQDAAADHVSSFDERQVQQEDVEYINHGTRTVALKDIIGSVGKYHDFDSRFRPKKHVAGKRFTDIKKAMRNGERLPPVKLYQIRDEYYVLDGNHRVAAAKELGQDEILAEVMELLSGDKSVENLLYIERKKFYQTTGLPGKIRLTEVGKYNYLEKQIKRHRNYLENISGRDTDFQKAAKDWYNTIYVPLAAIIENGGLLKYFPGRTISDLYAYISYNQWERKSSHKYGIGVNRLIPENMETFRKQMLEKSTPEYPEMQRTTSCFVLINVDAASETTVMDKLFELDEVREVHTVHGNFDVLAKIVLKRDLLASDTEIIARFVDRYVRRISGIHSTQTIIPGISKVKDELFS